MSESLLLGSDTDETVEGDVVFALIDMMSNGAVKSHSWYYLININDLFINLL